jgi:desulfoferrodoxin (superoxide reductase-like protein)
LKKDIEVVEAKGVLTLTEPGKWAGRERNHVPRCEIKDGRATVTSGHRMESDHWIDYIYSTQRTRKAR